MRTYLPIPCPGCNNLFTPTRKNQLYCKSDCRTDFNNQKSQQRYHAFQKEAPQLSKLKEEVRQLRAYITASTFVIEGVQEEGVGTIRYQGRLYKQGRKVDHYIHRISIRPGGALLLPGNKIVYTKTHTSGGRQSCWEYEPEK